MDNIEEIRQQELETNYIKQYAKYKLGDIVGFMVENTATLGIINDISLGYFKHQHNKEFVVIIYNIVTPIGEVSKNECELFAASDYICRRYAKIPLK